MLLDTAYCVQLFQLHCYKYSLCADTALSTSERQNHQQPPDHVADDRCRQLPDLPPSGRQVGRQVVLLKGPIKAVSCHKIAPNHFKTTYRSVLTFQGKKQSITHLFKTFSGLDQVVMQNGRKIRSTERFKTSAILNARFRKSYFKLKVNGRAVTSQTDRATKRGSRVCVSVHRATDLEKCPVQII